MGQAAQPGLEALVQPALVAHWTQDAVGGEPGLAALEVPHRVDQVLVDDHGTEIRRAPAERPCVSPVELDLSRGHLAPSPRHPRPRGRAGRAPLGGTARTTTGCNGRTGTPSQ